MAGALTSSASRAAALPAVTADHCLPRACSGCYLKAPPSPLRVGCAPASANAKRRGCRCASRARPAAGPAPKHAPQQAPPSAGPAPTARPPSQRGARVSDWHPADSQRAVSGRWRANAATVSRKTLRKRKGKWYCLSPGARPTLGSAEPRGPGDALSHLPPSKACPTDFLAGRGFCRQGPWGPKGSPFLFYLAPTCATPFNLISPLSPRGVSPQLLAGKTGLDFCNALGMKQPWTNHSG